MVQKRAVAVVVAVLTAAVGWAQMDLLPFVFRDIPPELERGIPTDMSYEEFRQLNRNVDFFSMGMSMIAPGYAMFQVERPAAGIAIAAARVAGYGLMAAGMARQWDDLRDLWQLQSIAPDKFDSLKVNGALFAAGVCVNFALWGIDILGAYHVAKEERDYVIYRYGLARSSTGSADPALEVIRSQFRRDDALARPRTAASALRYLEGDPRSRAFGEVSYYLAVLLVRLGEPDEAFAHLLRGLAVDPSSPYAFALRSAAVDLLTKYWLRWHADRALLWETLQSGTGGGPGGDEGLVALVELAPRIANRRIVEMLWLFADRYLASSTRPADGDRVLAALGTSFARLRRTELEAAAWAKLLTFYPESPMRDEALRRAIEAYRAREDSAAVEKLGTLEREGE